MLKAKTFLGIDFGAGTLKVAEFEPADGGGLRLLRFGVRALGLPGSQDAARDGVLKRALTELLAEGGFKSARAFFNRQMPFRVCNPEVLETPALKTWFGG